MRTCSLLCTQLQLYMYVSTYSFISIPHHHHPACNPTPPSYCVQSHAAIIPHAVPRRHHPACSPTPPSSCVQPHATIILRAVPRRHHPACSPTPPCILRAAGVGRRPAGVMYRVATRYFPRVSKFHWEATKRTGAEFFLLLQTTVETRACSSTNRCQPWSLLLENNVHILA